MSVSEASAPITPRTNYWILSPFWDLLLFVATPLLIIPSIFIAQQRWSVEAIALFVASFGALGHHMPGMIRAYGDRDLFERFKTRFVAAPVFFAAVCVLFTLREMHGIVLIVYLWGVWHGLMQTYGFLRIYDSKVQSFASLTSRLDQLMCLAWFGSGVVLSPTRMQSLLDTFYQAGGTLLPGAAISNLRTLVLGGLIAVNVAWLANTLYRWRKGTPPSPIKLLLMVTSFGFWWYSNLIVGNILVGVALFEIFHDVQYLSIVWIFNQKRANAASASLSRFVQFLFRRSGALVGVYVGVVFAYGSLNYAAVGLPAETVKRALTGLLLASTLLHFYYDGFIWKVREKSTRESLGLEGGKTERGPGWWLHGLRWSFFILPVAWLGISEARGSVPSDLARTQAIAEALPRHAEAQYNLGVELAERGEAESAIERYRAATELRPDFFDGWYNLGNALTQSGRLDQAIAAYRQALLIDPEAVSAHNNLGNALIAAGRPDEAIDAYQEAVRLSPETAAPRVRLGTALAASGRVDEGLAALREAVRLDSESSLAHFELAGVLSAAGQPGEALAELGRAIALDPDFAPAHFNLANALAGRGEVGQAITSYREAIRLEPDPAAHFNLANLLARTGDLEAAAREYAEAIALDRDFAPAHHNLGVVLHSLNRPADAVERYREALRLEPGYADAHGSLASALDALGRPEEAAYHRAEAARLAAG